MQNNNSKAGTEVPTSTNADDTMSSQTIAKPNVSRRVKSKELFERHSTFKDGFAWHIWKMAFDFGNSHSKEVLTDFIMDICSSAENKYQNNKHRPLSEASIEAETCIQVCKAILAAMNNGG